MLGWGGHHGLQPRDGIGSGQGHILSMATVTMWKMQCHVTLNPVSLIVHAAAFSHSGDSIGPYLL